MERKDCTHKLRCRHAIGTHGLEYTMDCIPLKEMKDGRLKVLVFGDRYWKRNPDKKRIRYVHPSRVLLKGKSQEQESKQQKTKAEKNSFVVQPADFKYMQIPNICFSLTSVNDNREKKFRKQRLERGFDDSETWSLMGTIASFIIPRLECYEEKAKSFLKREPELEEDIQCFLKAMKLVVRSDEAAILTEEEEKQLLCGLEAFPRIFMSLWW